MIALYIVPALLNWTVAGLYASDSRWGLAALWLVAGGLWLAAARSMAQARRIHQEIDRLTRAPR